MPKKERAVIVEHMYPKTSFMSQFDWAGVWRKWKAYRDIKTAERAVELLNRKSNGFVLFRIKV